MSVNPYTCLGCDAWVVNLQAGPFQSVSITIGSFSVTSWQMRCAMTALFVSAPLWAQDMEVVVPHETRDVKMPSGDAARGIPMPDGSLDQEVFRARRQRLMNAMDGGVAVIFAAERIGGRSRQNMDFYYLTGLAYEEGAALVLAPQAETWKEYLFLKPVNPESNIWDGERATLGRAMELGTGFGKVYRTNRLPSVLAKTVRASDPMEMVYLGPIVGYTSPVPHALDVARKVVARIPGASVRLADRILPELRQTKDKSEIELVQRAINITGQALVNAMQAVKPGMTEYELKLVIENTFRANGSRRPAFGSIVGSGPNGAILHYRDDTREMRDGEVVLCDVGAEWEQYAADVTRTFPINGRFSKRQREVYNTVLRAHRAALQQCKPGALLREDIHMAAVKVIEEAGFTDKFPHGTSHFLGLQVHDVGVSEVPLTPGTIITIEPGIYLPDENLGIRIEDDVLITQSGYRILSNHIPRTIEEIEALMAKGSAKR